MVEFHEMSKNKIEKFLKEKEIIYSEKENSSFLLEIKNEEELELFLSPIDLYIYKDGILRDYGITTIENKPSGGTYILLIFDQSVDKNVVISALYGGKFGYKNYNGSLINKEIYLSSKKDRKDKNYLGVFNLMMGANSAFVIIFFGFLSILNNFYITWESSIKILALPIVLAVGHSYFSYYKIREFNKRIVLKTWNYNLEKNDKDRNSNILKIFIAFLLNGIFIGLFIMSNGSVLNGNLKAEVDEIKTGILLDNWIYRNENGTIVAHQIFISDPNVKFLDCKKIIINVPGYKSNKINKFKCSFNVN